MQVDKEIDDGREEVLCRVGEERLRAPFLLAAALIKRGQQSGRRLRGGRKVGNILPLDRIYSVGILHVRKVHDTEPTFIRQLTALLILAILIKQRLRQGRKFVVIDHHRKTLFGVLPYERVYDAERLTRTRCAENDGRTERIRYVDEAVVHPPSIVVYHRDVYRIRSLHKLFRLLERLVLEVETVITYTVVVVLGDAVESLMDEHSPDYRAEGVDDAVGREAHHIHAEGYAMEDEA